MTYLVISGGTGGNSICPAFDDVCYVLPVSDDGGSSSEIIRVLGGPSIGDIRSRLIRLIPPSPANSPQDAIRRLLAYRFPPNTSQREARDHWRDIIEGKSSLWKGIPTDRKETIRGFLVYFESELLKRAHKNFDFRNGSVGNYFLAAAQGFFRSLPSAIFLFSAITNSQANILPVIVTNHTVTIAVALEDGENIIGQCEISHPVAPSEAPISGADEVSGSLVDSLGRAISSKQNVMFESVDKGSYGHLPSPINRLYYINSYGMEIHPRPNPDFLSNLAFREILVYSCGSLWTSIMPCLALQGVAGSIAGSRTLRAKVLLLNAENDRETEGYTATDFIRAIARTLNRSYSAQAFESGTTYPISAFITDMVYLKGTRIKVDVKEIMMMGVRCREIEGGPQYDADCVRTALSSL